MKTVLIWLYHHHICTRLILELFAKYTWQHGYMKAVNELERGAATHLSATERLSSPVWRLRLPLVTPETMLAFDEGYARAITMFRLGYNPRQLFRDANEFAVPYKVSAAIDDIVYKITSGGLKADPRKYLDLPIPMHWHRRMQERQQHCYEVYARAMKETVAKYEKPCTEEGMRAIRAKLALTDNVRPISSQY